MFALFLASLVHYGLKKDGHILAGAALALSLIKPQTVALPLLVTSLRLRREGLAAFGVTFVSWVIVAFASVPDCPVRWWANASWITREAGRAVPTIWGLSWFLTSGYWLGGALFLALLGTVLLNTSFPFVLTVGLFLAVYMKPYDLVLLFIPALSKPDRKLLFALVVLSHLLLFYVALTGRGGDVFILLTLVTFAHLIYSDRTSMMERLGRCQAFMRGRLSF